MAAARKMHLVAYLKSGPTASYASAWRHPAAPLNDLGEPERYEHLARMLEAARFDAGFFADGMGVADIYKNSYADYLGRGGQVSLLDPLMLLPLMARVTTRLGLGTTLSTTFNNPYPLARALGTLDILSKGRAAWNVVASANDYEARNCGMDGIPPKALRYDRADEVMEACFALWDSRGREFAGRWAEMIVCSPATKPDAITLRADMLARIEAAGRAPSECAVLPSLSVVIGETDAIAREKAAFLDRLIDPELVLASRSALLGVDMSQVESEADAARGAGSQGVQGSRDRMTQVARAQGISFAEAVRKPRGLLAGSPATIADYMEDWFRDGACDGFVLPPTVFPSTNEEFGRKVVPEPQRRGAFRREYAGRTLLSHRFDIQGRGAKHTGEGRAARHHPHPRRHASRPWSALRGPSPRRAGEVKRH